MGLVVAVVAAVVLVGSYLTWSATRLDRLSARVEAAWGALDAQLVRRAAASSDLAAHVRRHRMVPEEHALELQHAAAAARDAAPRDREARENELTRAIRTVLEQVGDRGGKTAALADELAEAGGRVVLARQFYNDAVRDDRDRRRRWVPRLLTVAHRGEERRSFFEIDDAPVERPSRTPAP